MFHPDLNLETYEYDVACVRVMEPFPFSDTIQPIRLVAPYSDIPAGLLVEISGWGFNVSYKVLQILYLI